MHGETVKIIFMVVFVRCVTSYKMSSSLPSSALLMPYIFKEFTVVSLLTRCQEFHYLTIKMLYNRCTGIYKLGNNTYPRCIRRRSNLGHIFRGKKGHFMGRENWYVSQIKTTTNTIWQINQTIMGPVQGSQYSDSLRAGRSRYRIPVGARFSAPVHTGPGSHPAYYAMGTGSFPGVKQPGGWHWTPNPI